MADRNQNALVRQYAAGQITWRELRERGFEDYVEVLGALGELGLRPPIAAMEGPNVKARQRGRALLREVLNANVGNNMPPTPLLDLYRAYIDCLNLKDWDALGRHVDDDVEHNGRPLNLAGYRAMLVKDYEDIPDLRFEIELLACTPPVVAARLRFHCSPKGRFLGLDVDGRKVAFTENVFYEFRGAKIVSVWSILDRAAIEAQLVQPW